MVRLKVGIMLSKKRILYLMHIDWRWIKQRPHFIAEGLSAFSKVLVLYRLSRSRRKLPQNKSNVFRLPFLPTPRRILILDKIMQKLWLLLIGKLYFRPDLIWLTHPYLYQYLPVSLKKIPIFYDCMDDVLAFPQNKKKSTLLFNLEKKLVNECIVVICSSEHLANVITSRYRVSKEKVIVIRNGISEEFLMKAKSFSLTEKSLSVKPAGSFLDIVYIGTISTWFDIESIQYCLEVHKDLRFHLIGPSDIVLPQHPRLLIYGAIEHDKLWSYVEKATALIMSFKHIPLVKSVDPVKLYEYIAFGKEIFCIYYDEIKRFSNFVHFYKNKEELSLLIEKLKSGRLCRKNSPDLRLKFISENTWENRIAQLNNFLTSFSSGRGSLL